MVEDDDGASSRITQSDPASGSVEADRFSADWSADLPIEESRPPSVAADPTRAAGPVSRLATREESSKVATSGAASPSGRPVAG
jgi:hypothetical protein